MSRSEDSRLIFEDIAIEKGYPVGCEENGDYIDARTQAAWVFWRTAKARPSKADTGVRRQAREERNAQALAQLESGRRQIAIAQELKLSRSAIHRLKKQAITRQPEQQAA